MKSRTVGRLVMALIAVAAVALTPLRADAAEGDDGGRAPLVTAGDGRIDDAYVVFMDDSATRGRAAVTSRHLLERTGNADVEVTRRYAHVGSGFAAKMDRAAVERLRNDPSVAAIYEDFTVRTSPPPSTGPGWPDRPASVPTVPWSLDRIDQRHPQLDQSFRPAGDGSGVDIYIIDSGIRVSHREFGGRVKGGASFIAGTDLGDYGDCIGHGTSMASAAAGDTYGVAKKADLYSVRVFGCNREGAFSAIVAGVDWVIRNHSGPSVVNMSFGQLKSEPYDRLVQRLFDAGIVVVAAAGNDDADACDRSPGRSDAAITVGSTDIADRRATSSNWGRCIDLFAPGVAVLVAGRTSDTAVDFVWGTSPAAAYVSGAAALELQDAPWASPTTVRARLLANSQSGVTNLAGSPSRLLHVVPAADSEPPSTNPNPPTNIKSVRYSSTSGQISWTRATDPGGHVVGYEVTRNGQSLGVMDTLGVYEPSLAPGLYTYTVRSVDNDGNRSASASVDLWLVPPSSHPGGR